MLEFFRQSLMIIEVQRDDRAETTTKARLYMINVIFFIHVEMKER